MVGEATGYSEKGKNSLQTDRTRAKSHALICSRACYSLVSRCSSHAGQYAHKPMLASLMIILNSLHRLHNHRTHHHHNHHSLCLMTFKIRLVSSVAMVVGFIVLGIIDSNVFKSSLATDFVIGVVGRNHIGTSASIIQNVDIVEIV